MEKKIQNSQLRECIPTKLIHRCCIYDMDYMNTLSQSIPKFNNHVSDETSWKGKVNHLLKLSPLIPFWIHVAYNEFHVYRFFWSIYWSLFNYQFFSWLFIFITLDFMSFLIFPQYIFLYFYVLVSFFVVSWVMSVYRCQLHFKYVSFFSVIIFPLRCEPVFS